MRRIFGITQQAGAKSQSRHMLSTITSFIQVREGCCLRFERGYGYELMNTTIPLSTAMANHGRAPLALLPPTGVVVVKDKVSRFILFQPGAGS